jgi:hypothetical protein
MKTRICIIGDSHAASLKRAWDGMATLHDEFELRFFCARGLELSGMVVDDLRLIPNSESLARTIRFTAGGGDQIDPREYDTFLLYGLGCQPYFVQTDVFLSQSTLAAALRDFAKPSLSFELLLRLRAVTAKDIYVGHQPLEAAKPDSPADEMSVYSSSLRRMNEILYRPLRATIVSQPLDTIAGGRFTNSSFSKGSRRLAVGDNLDDELHPDDDHLHMNDEYGSRWLTKFLTKELAGNARDLANQVPTS